MEAEKKEMTVKNKRTIKTPLSQPKKRKAETTEPRDIAPPKNWENNPFGTSLVLPK